MKRTKIILLLIMVLFVLNGCSLNYSLDTYGIFDIGYSKLENNAFIARVHWDKDSSLEIEIPSNYNDIPVKELGGYFGTGVPSPFFIEIDTETFCPDATRHYATNYDPDWINSDEYEIYFYNFVITLPEKLEKIEYINNDVSCAEYEYAEASLIKVFVPNFYFIISTENNCFYSENGYLYYKNNKQLVDDFLYSEECGSNNTTSILSWSK